MLQYIVLGAVIAASPFIYNALHEKRQKFHNKILALIQTLIETSGTEPPPDWKSWKVIEKLQQLPRPTQIVLEQVIPNLLQLELSHEVPNKLVVQDQHGKMRLNGLWCHFEARTFYSNRNSGFVWLAKVEIIPFVHVYVLDAFVDGQGYLDARLFGAIPLASASGNEDLDIGEAQRFLAECVWTPESLLFNPQVECRPVSGDEQSFTVGIRVGESFPRIQFALADRNENELLEEFSGLECLAIGGRPRIEANGTVRRLPWHARFFNWQRFDEYHLPTNGEVSWVVDGVDEKYFECELKNVFCCDVDANLRAEDYFSF